MDNHPQYGSGCWPAFSNRVDFAVISGINTLSYVLYPMNLVLSRVYKQSRVLLDTEITLFFSLRASVDYNQSSLSARMFQVSCHPTQKQYMGWLACQRLVSLNIYQNNTNNILSQLGRNIGCKLKNAIEGLGQPFWILIRFWWYWDAYWFPIGKSLI